MPPGLIVTSVAAIVFETKKLVLSAMLHRPALRLPAWRHIGEPEHERIWRLACRRGHLRLDRRQRRRRLIALVDPLVVQRNVLERLHRHAEILGQHLWRGMRDPVGDQQRVEFGGVAVVESETNSQPSGSKPCSECGKPAGKYQRSPSFTSATCGRPLSSRIVTRQLP